MPKYKVKDLMVNVFPEEEGTILPPDLQQCPLPCPEHISLIADINPASRIQPIDCACPFPQGSTLKPVETVPLVSLLASLSPIIEEFDTEPLTRLKAQLRNVLARVESREQRLHEALSPQSVEAAEIVERKLAEALAEIRAQKEALKSKANPKSS
jgi:hypothetical protein